MRRDRSRSRRTVHPDPHAGPDPAAPLPSARVMAVFAAFPVAIVAIASFPVAAAFAFALLVGAVAGAALGRRYPSAVDRTLPVPGTDSTAAGDR
jgi:hypothetical protein